MEKDKKRKIILWSVYGLLVVWTILTFIFTKEIWGYWVVEGDTKVLVGSIFIGHHFSDIGFFQYMGEKFLPNLFRTVQIITIAITFAIILHFAAKITFHTKKSITISKLILNFVKWVIAIASVFFIMWAWGADTTMMLASAGVITLIIGLGSQALVADILAGIFIVFEGDFQVGDIVIIDDWRGEVQAIGIRTTKLIDAGGNVKIVNNSEIKTIINQTKELSIAKCYVGVSYADRIEKIETVIADNLDKIKEKIPAIAEGPYYKGVSELADSSVVLLFVAKCKEEDIYQVQRDLNRQIKIMFDDNDINIPFPQLTISKAEEGEKEKISRKVEKKAEAFAEEQKVLSKDIEDKK